jgi:hypothetical protein
MRNLPRFANVAALCTSLLAVTLLLAGSAKAGAQTSETARGEHAFVPSSGQVTLENHMPAKVLDGRATRVDHYNPENKLRLVLAVHDSHMAEEEQFIKELTTKGSPGFHKFLTQEQWIARFAPAAEDEQAVVDWAQSVGLTVTQRYPNRLLVDVEAPAGVIEKAFGVTINNYKVGDEVDFSNDRDPVVPANLSGILHAVAGLNNIERVRRLGTKYKTVKGADYVPGPVIADGGGAHGVGDPSKVSASGGPTRKDGDLASSSTPGELASSSKSSDSYGLGCIGTLCVMDPDNIWSSEGYNYNGLQRFSHCCNVHNDTTGSPAVSSIALVGYGAFNFSDVETFFDWYGLAYNFNVWFVDGSGPAVDGEAPLDVEYSGAMSNNPGTPNNTSHIYEYEMADGSLGTYEDAFAQIVSQDHAKVVSTSYGGTEALSGPWNTAETGALHTTFNNMVATGYTLIAASGDNGASDGCGDARDVDYPSSDPDFIAAGGTQLLLNGSGIYQSEIGWQGEFWTNADNNGHGGACANNHGGSTGGVSSLFTAPWWQPASILSPTYLWRGGDSTNPVGSEYYYDGNTNRVLPDISLTANPDVMGEWYYSTCCNGGGWQDEGGTSIVAPELAGFFAQENTYLNYIGNICGSGTDACTPVGLASPFLYENGDNDTNHNPYYDMLSGCSDNDITVQYDLYYYCAYKGFDLVTGWGSANMMQLAWGINWQLIPAYGQPSITFTGGPATGDWYNTDQEVSWTVTDGLSQGSGTPSGVAGFTQGWDSIPSDPFSEAHSGEGNSFYSGPEYAFGTAGCLSLNGGFGCSGNGGAQGCHTVQVEGWDHQGATAYGSYGPICYDTVDPTVTITNSPTTSYSVWVNTPVTVTLHSVDPGGANSSGIYFTAYDVDNPESDCYPDFYSTGCYSYGGPITISTQGQHYIYYFARDVAGNFSTENYEWVSIDLTAPTTTSSLSGNLVSGTYYSGVRVTLTGTDTGGSGLKATYYSVDGGGNTTYTAPFSVSGAGGHSVVYWSVDHAGNVESAHTVTFTVATPVAAVLTSPAPGSTLAGSTVGFSWGAATAASGYSLWLGSAPGTDDLYHSGKVTVTSVSAGNLPVNGEPVYATLFTTIGTATLSNTYSFTAAAQAVLIAPAPATTLVGPTATFSWTPGTGNTTGYSLWLGSTGVGSSNLYNSHHITATSVSAGNLPTNGEQIYARLSTTINGITYHYDYLYTAVAQAVLTTPAPATTLVGPTVTFTWTAGTGNTTGYSLWLGSTPGADDLYHSGEITATSAKAGNLPTNGQPVYATLFTTINGVTVQAAYTYTAVAQAVLTTPAPGSVLGGSSVAFTWTPGTGGTTSYSLWLGSAPGTSNLYHSGTTTATTVTATGLPTNGETIYATLYTTISGVQEHTAYTYTAAP